MHANHVLIGGLGSAPAYIATFSYNDLGYQSLHLEGYVTGPSREDMVQRLLTLKDEGQVGARTPSS